MYINGNNSLSIVRTVPSSDFKDFYSNPNLLINGGFQVNQRGLTTYNTNGKYCVDRWKLVSGSVVVENNGITLNGTITQTLENIPTQTVTASVDEGGGTVTKSYSNGIFTLTATGVLIKWAKLEIGLIATAFSPRPYAEELANCQRYFQNIECYRLGMCGARITTQMRGIINYLTEMRTTPTITQIAPVNFYDLTASTSANQTAVGLASVTTLSKTSALIALINISNLVLGDLYIVNTNTNCFTLDAEIY